MEALGVAASVVGVVGPALHGVRLLVDDIQKIADAPEVVASLKNELLAVGTALESLKAVSDSQWKSLGDTVVAQAETAMTSCALSCDKLRTALGRWTRHSDDRSGKLSWRDRATIGFFKESQLKSMTEQVEKCKTTLTWVASVATLHSSLQQGQVTEEIMSAVSSAKTGIANAITELDGQLVEVNAKLGTLVLAGQDDSEPKADRDDALAQVAVQQKIFGLSRKLLEELLSSTQAAAANAQRGQGRVEMKFGDHNRGSQTGINHGTIHNKFS